MYRSGRGEVEVKPSPKVWAWVKPSTRPGGLPGSGRLGGTVQVSPGPAIRSWMVASFGVCVRHTGCMPILVWAVAKSAKILGIVAGFGPPHVRAGAHCARAGARITRYITRFLQVSPDFFSFMTLAFSFCHLIIRLMSIMTIFLSIITILKKERIYIYI